MENLESLSKSELEARIASLSIEELLMVSEKYLNVSTDISQLSINRFICDVPPTNPLYTKGEIISIRLRSSIDPIASLSNFISILEKSSNLESFSFPIISEIFSTHNSSNILNLLEKIIELSSGI